MQRRLTVAPFAVAWEPWKKKLQYVKRVAPALSSSTRVSGANGIVANVAGSQSYVEMSYDELIYGSRAAGCRNPE